MATATSRLFLEFWYRRETLVTLVQAKGRSLERPIGDRWFN
jgi:hypothetical protein